MNTYLIAVKTIGGTIRTKGEITGPALENMMKILRLCRWRSGNSVQKKKDNDGDHYEKHSERPLRLS